MWYYVWDTCCSVLQCVAVICDTTSWQPLTVCSRWLIHTWEMWCPIHTWNDAIFETKMNCNSWFGHATYSCMNHDSFTRFVVQQVISYCNTLQHTATRCNTWYHTPTSCNTLQHAATRCNTWYYFPTCNHVPDMHIPPPLLFVNAGGCRLGHLRHPTHSYITEYITQYIGGCRLGQVCHARHSWNRIHHISARHAVILITCNHRHAIIDMQSYTCNHIHAITLHAHRAGGCRLGQVQ